MNAEIFTQLQEHLKRGPMPLKKALAFIRDAGSDWSFCQLRLFIMCMDGLDLIGKEGHNTVCLGEELADAILAVPSALGRPVPAKENRKRLPAQFVTTDEQVKSIAKKTQGLEVFGPGLIKTTTWPSKKWKWKRRNL